MKSRSASSNDMVGSSKNRAKSLKKHQEEEVPQDHNDLFSQPLFMSRPPASTFPNLHNQPYSFSSLNQPAALSTTPRGFSSQPQLPSYSALEKHKVEDLEGEAEERRGESAALLLPEEEELRPIPVPPRPDNISRPAAANVHPPTALQSQAAAASYRDCAASLVPVPSHPELPGRTRSGSGMNQNCPQEVPGPRPEQGKGGESQTEEKTEAKRRHEEMEQLNPFSPQLLYTDSFYQNRLQQEQNSLEELRKLREEERRNAIEREREKVPKVAAEVPKPISEGTETLRREGVLVVRSIEEFKGKLALPSAATVSKAKRKMLKFKPNEIIRVTSGMRFIAIAQSNLCW